MNKRIAFKIGRKLIREWELIVNKNDESTYEGRFNKDDYLFEMDTRSELEKHFEKIKKNVRSELLTAVEEADLKLKAITEQSRCIWGIVNQKYNSWNSTKHWWLFRRPKGITGWGWDYKYLFGKETNRNGFDFEVEQNIVSVWVANEVLSKIPSNYFSLNFDSGKPMSTFCEDFKIEAYNFGFSEHIVSKGSEPVIKQIKKACFGTSFCNEVGRVCKIRETEHILLLFNYKYDHKLTGITKGSYNEFIGTFDFDI